MLRIAENLKKIVNFKAKTIEIDNLIFRLHYRITFWMLLCAVGIVCAHEYIGERIKCIVGTNVLAPVIETFCFFTSTYTVVRHTNRSVLNRNVPHIGVGPDTENDDIIRHAYYQWVPFFLLFQAMCFYLPHALWRIKEGGRMKALVDGFNLLEMLDETHRTESLNKVQKQFHERVFIYRNWALTLILCEILNLVNLVWQVHLTNVFLGYQFMDLGTKVLRDEPGDEYHPLDVVFPKVTKCTFKKFGPSGTIQFHDTICVMALNIINEKTFTIFWYWYLILFIVTVLGILWRMASYFGHSSVSFNIVNFTSATQLRLNKSHLVIVMKSFTFGEWMFLRYLASNMDGRMFRDLLCHLATSLSGQSNYEDGFLLPPRKDDPYVLLQNIKNA